MRPSTLNLRNQHNHDVSRHFLREAFTAWNERAEDCVVPEQNIQSLFYELKLFPTAEQVHDMLRTAKLIVRGCNNCNKLSKHKNGLTFGEFSVLLSDIRKLRHTSILNNHEITQSDGFHHASFPNIGKNEAPSERLEEHIATACETMAGPEVFLGGSCNPTTWRADVAIPTLNKLGISFYNPQVSEWTPDLLELEHRAKEKAKVLFFVMDSQTRSTAGAIEVAHIAGRNSKHLVLVLLPYKQQQKILNDTLSIDEYMDLSRNQLLLKQLVRRRGLPVLDNIPLALEYIKNILSGGSCRGHPENIATRLISVRRTYDRVVDNSTYLINMAQCQKALLALGYPPGIASVSVITEILANFEDICQNKDKKDKDDRGFSPVMITSSARNDEDFENILITFDGFCILDSYLSVLHQEILETSCVSPIKGTNLQQPPIYLTDSPEWSHRIPPSPVCPNKGFISSETAVKSQPQSPAQNNVAFEINSVAALEQFQTSETKRDSSINVIDRVASSSSVYDNNEHKSAQTETISIAVCCNRLLQQWDAMQDTQKNIESVWSNSVDSANHDEHSALKTRDIYLGGSCWMFTRWRQKYATPYLKSKNITFYTSSLHEGVEGTLSARHKEETSREDEDELLFSPAVLDASRILLFVITNETRSLGAMTLAAHYIGMGYNVVICVQMLTNGCTVRGLQLSNSAVKDYNRGRAYLIDLAKRHGIPVFNDIDASLECAIGKLRLH